MGKRGPQPTPLETLEKRGSWRAAKRRREQAAKPAPERKPVSLPDLSDLENHCRTLIPGYNPWDGCGPYVWDRTLAERAVNFFHGKLTFIEGDVAGQPFILQPWQQAVVGNLFGWVHGETGLRRYREFLLFVPRKNGKTPLAAGIVLKLLFDDDEPGAQIYGAASEFKQASLLFRHAAGMVKRNPDLKDACQIFTSAAQKGIEVHDTDSLYRVLTSSADAQHGQNVHGAVVDEIHVLDSRDLVDTLTSGMGNRKQPLICYLTTSDYDRESFCNDTYKRACEVRDGVNTSESALQFLPVIWEAAPEDDWTAEATWAKANPNLGVSVRLEFLRTECEKAQRSAAYENVFKRLYLNIRTQQNVKFIDLNDWDACRGDTTEPELIGAECYGGLDLGATKDLCALSLVFPGEKYKVRVWCWAPQAGARDRQHQDKVPYLTWEQEGWLTLTEKPSTDYAVIRRDINALGEKYRIREIAVDRLFNAEQLSNELSDDGFTIVKHGQGFLDMASPTRTLERMVLNHQLEHDGNPVLRWAANNCQVDTDAAGNIKPSKKRSSEKIDPIVAVIMGLGRAVLQDVEAEGELDVVFI